MHHGEPDLRHHGDADAGPGLLDFAVNVQGEAPPGWLTDRLAAVLPELGRYPSAAHDARARDAVAARHGRHPDEVLLQASTASMAGVETGHGGRGPASRLSISGAPSA